MKLLADISANHVLNVGIMPMNTKKGTQVFSGDGLKNDVRKQEQNRSVLCIYSFMSGILIVMIGLNGVKAEWNLQTLLGVHLIIYLFGEVTVTKHLV